MIELTRQCLSLNKEQKERLVKIISRSLDDINGEMRYRTMMKIAEEIFWSDISDGSRRYEAVLSRRFIAYQLISEGLSYSAIGRLLNRKHSSVIHMEKMMENIFDFPEAFERENQYWHEFTRKLKQYDKAGTI